jgi:hypothetical protein
MLRPSGDTIARPVEDQFLDNRSNFVILQEMATTQKGPGHESEVPYWARASLLSRRLYCARGVFSFECGREPAGEPLPLRCL